MSEGATASVPALFKREAGELRARMARLILDATCDLRVNVANPKTSAKRAPTPSSLIPNPNASAHGSQTSLPVLFRVHPDDVRLSLADPMATLFLDLAAVELLSTKDR